MDDHDHGDNDDDDHHGDNDNDGKCWPSPYASESLVSMQSLRSPLPPSRRSSFDHSLCLRWSYLQNFHVFYLSTPSWR